MSTDLGTDDLEALEQARNVLELEARKGYQDSSAANGVAEFVGERIARLLPRLDDEGQRVLREVDALVSSYGRMTPVTREQCATEALRQLSGLASTVRLNVRASGREPTPPRRRSPSRRTSSGPTQPRSGIKSLDESVQYLPGVGPGRARQLEQLGVTTIRDLLYLFPRRYIDYSRLDPIAGLRFGEISTVQGEVVDIISRPTRTGRPMVDVVVQDQTGLIHAIFFSPYIEQQLRPGMRISLSGRVDQLRGQLCFKSPEWEELSAEAVHTGRIVPVYPLTRGLYQKTMRRIVRIALDVGLGLVEDHLPAETLERVNPPLIPLRDALSWIHYPEGDTIDEARRRWVRAKSRLAFDELLLMQLGLLQRKQAVERLPGNSIIVEREQIDQFIATLPFELTAAQERAIDEVLHDMALTYPMSRLLQGDVGSGKTVVAATAALVAVRAGYQAALMAPTELLAEQHLRSLTRLYEPLPANERPRVGLITGSATATERRELYAAISTGYLQIVVGTHALIQELVEFERLGLAIIDEQHRFGVEQRGTLRSKGVEPDILVMTATPIPRSLALTLHGDLDVSTLDELPPGRQPIETRWVRGRERDRAYEFVRDQVSRGYQAFIVFPLVEESEAVDARAAVEEHERLSKQVFPDLRVGLLHGRMRPSEKDEVMLAFRDRELDVLVTTSVVEVGIDIPNATVMLIENADRFGLAQLHQFRGRVGRGEGKSYCLLVADNVSEEGRTRLEAMVDSQDGFRLAQIDLEMRGPGDMFGTRQSGLPELTMANLADVRDLERARTEAARLLSDDPDLAAEDHRPLRARVEAVWSAAITEVS